MNKIINLVQAKIEQAKIFEEFSIRSGADDTYYVIVVDKGFVGMDQLKKLEAIDIKPYSIFAQDIFSMCISIKI